MNELEQLSTAEFFAKLDEFLEGVLISYYASAQEFGPFNAPPGTPSEYEEAKALIAEIKRRLLAREEQA